MRLRVCAHSSQKNQGRSFHLSGYNGDIWILRTAGGSAPAAVGGSGGGGGVSARERHKMTKGRTVDVDQKELRDMKRKVGYNLGICSLSWATSHNGCSSCLWQASKLP